MGDPDNPLSVEVNPDGPNKVVPPTRSNDDASTRRWSIPEVTWPQPSYEYGQYAKAKWSPYDGPNDDCQAWYAPSGYAPSSTQCQCWRRTQCARQLQIYRGCA